MRTLRNKAVAAKFGLHGNLLSGLQRAGAVPQDVSEFTDHDEDFLQKISLVVGDKELLRLQISRISKVRREALLENARVFDLKNWERYAYRRFKKWYLQGKAVDSAVVITELYMKFNVAKSDFVVNRVVQFRKKAADEVRGAKKNNERKDGD